MKTTPPGFWRGAILVLVLAAASVLAWNVMTDTPARPGGSTSTVGLPSPSTSGAASAPDSTTPPRPSPASTTAPSGRSTSQSPPPARPTVTSTSTTASPAPGIRVRLERVEDVRGVASQPGEVAGPAVRVSVVLTNTTTSRVPLSGVVVNGYYGSPRRPANPLSGPGVVSFPAGLAARESARGVYVFAVPEVERAGVVVEVDLSSSGRPVLFTRRP